MATKLTRTLKRLWSIYRKKPHIFIGEYGQLTKSNHHYSVGFHSRSGMCGALIFKATDAGHAEATMYAKTYANILGLPIIDQRTRADKVAETSNG